MSGYTKLFSSILDSTVWETPLHIRIVWITMLAMSDRDGVIEASVPGLAKRSGVTREQCEEALACLMSPDPDSRTPDFEGRRIEKVDGGWRLLNHLKYRQKRSEEERRERAAERSRRYRESKSSEISTASVDADDDRDEALQSVTRHAPSRSVTHRTQNHAIADADTDSEADVRTLTPARTHEAAPLEFDSTPFGRRTDELTRSWKRAYEKTIGHHPGAAMGPKMAEATLALQRVAGDDDAAFTSLVDAIVKSYFEDSYIRSNPKVAGGKNFVDQLDRLIIASRKANENEDPPGYSPAKHGEPKSARNYNKWNEYVKTL